MDIKEKRNINFELEFFLTVTVLSLVTFLLSDIIYTYRLYIILGLACGFSFSWFSRRKQFLFLSILTRVATLAIFLWIMYSIINSSLFYVDVILIWIWGVLILEVVLSFNAGSALFLNYIQILSIPLLMSYPALVRGYSKTSFLLIAGYVLCWLAILKVKFYGFVKSEKREKYLGSYSVYLLIIFAFLSVSLSWLIFSKLPLGMIREGGLLPEDRIVSGERPEIMEKKYYDLQDGIQTDISGLIATLDSTEEKYEILGLLNSLIKESPFVMEVSKAEDGLIDYLKRPGYGLEEKNKKELTAAIKQYLDKKIELNLKTDKKNIEKILKKNIFNIKDRISAMAQVSKIQHANNHAQLKKAAKDLKDMFDRSNANVEAKRQLKASANQMRQWKELQIHRQLSDELKKKIDSSEGQLQKELENLQTEIEKTENLSDFKAMEGKFSKLKDATLTEGLEKSIEDLSDSKLKMMLSEKVREMKGKAKNPDLLTDEFEGPQEAGEGKYQKQYLPGKYKGLVRVFEGCVAVAPYDDRGVIKEKEVIICAQQNLSAEEIIEKAPPDLGFDRADPFKEADDIKDIEDSQGFLQRFSEFQKNIQEKKPDVEQEINEFLEMKVHSLIKTRTKEIKDLLKQSILSADSARQFLQQSEKLGSVKEAKDLITASKKLEADIESFANQGFILQNTKENLTQKIHDVKDLLLYGMTSDGRIEGKRPLKSKILADSQKEWEGLLEKAQMKEEDKEVLKNLEEQLQQAKTISQIENIKDAVSRGLAEALKAGMQEQEKNRIEQHFLELVALKKMFAVEDKLFDLREGIEHLKKSDPEKAKKIEKLLNKIKENSANGTIIEELEKLKRYIESNSLDSAEIQKKNERAIPEGLSDSLQIYIMPSSLIVPIGSVAPLKAIAIYNKEFLKEVDSDLEWSSSDMSVAVVDKLGVVKALSKGKTRIWADYKGVSSPEVDVLVAEGLSEDTDRAIKKEVMQ